MPPVVAAAGAAASAVAAGTATVAATIGVSTSTLVLGALSVGASVLLAPSAQDQKFAGIEPAQNFIDDGSKITVKQAVPMRRFPYGTVEVSGPMFFFELSNPWLVVGIILGDGPCDGFDSVRVAGRTVLFDAAGLPLTAPYKSGGNAYMKVSFRDGSDDQTLDPLLASFFASLPASFRQRGVCTMVIAYHYGTDRDHHELLWPSGDINTLVTLRGLKLWDPRQPGSVAGDKTTWVQTSNAALARAHYLTNVWKRPVDAAQLDTESLKTAASVCDQSVATWDGSAYGKERRYTANGVVMADQAKFDVINNLLTADNGSLLFRQDSYRFDSARYRKPAITLTDDDIIGPIRVRHATPTDRLVNVARSVFTASTRNNKKANGPVFQDADYNPAEDEELAETLQYPFTNSSSTVRRLQKQEIERRKAGRELQAPLGRIAEILEAGDVIRVDTRQYARVNGDYVLRSLEFTGGRFIARMEETGPQIYAWDAAQDDAEFSIDPADL